MGKYFKVGIIGFTAWSFVFVFGAGSVQAYCDSSALGIATYGQSSAKNIALQQCLIDAGYSIPAGATGYYGEQTRSAVKQFYSEQLSMPEWSGHSVGPIGRSTLVSIAQTPYISSITGTVSGYKQLTGVNELKKYLTAERSYGMNARAMGLDDSAGLAMPTVTTEGFSAEADSVQSTPDRVSETNVQIVGIDEPDIVKTDGQHIFVSRESRWYGWREPMVDVAVESSIAMPRYEPNPLAIVDAFPVDELAVISEEIEETGEMLLVKEKDILIIFSRPDIVAYDVSNPEKPNKLWEREIDNNTSIVTSRLYDETLYLITQTYFNHDKPCPIVPMRWGNRTLSIPCSQIMVPERIEPISHLYTVMKVDPSDGSVDAKTALAGDYGGVTVMMSADNLFVASRAQSTEYDVLLDIVIDSIAPYVPSNIVSQARTIRGYDISDSGKMSEISMVIESYLQSLSSDERLRIENEMENRMMDALKKRLRDMYQSRIVRIGLDTLEIKATGSVPGYLLNQFAMDEHEGNLRVAVTIDDGWGGAESANDVYVLNSSLDVVGQIQDLGLTERIYSVRFMGDTGYLVTFRQIDPFYVLDLSVPAAPKMSGELKIPGYSAYLEYLGDDLVLGVGREGSGVKLSVFDVSNPAKPIEKSKYQLKDSWTEVEGNHHAFLRDAKHEVFFIPGGSGGYIFSYEDGELSLEKALSGYGVKRALYIDDYMYVVSEDKIRVLDESDWEEVKSLGL